MLNNYFFVSFPMAQNHIPFTRVFGQQRDVKRQNLRNEFSTYMPRPSFLWQNAYFTKIYLDKIINMMNSV